MIVYRESVLDDVRDLADLHQRYISWGFLTSLGEDVLKWIYHSLVTYPKGVVIVAEEEDKIVGFVSGVTDLKEYYIFFFKRYFFRVMPKVLLRLSSAGKMVETLLYAGPKKETFSLPKEELLAIVVEKDYRGRKISQGLFYKLGEWFASRNVHRFKTTVGENNLKSIKFFQGLGCKEVGIDEIHRDQRSKIFVCEGNGKTTAL